MIEASPGRSERAFRSGNERLYEAYNDLHALAQDFEKPFDAPAILVVGHQTDGKSGTSFFRVCWRAGASASESWAGRKRPGDRLSSGPAGCCSHRRLFEKKEKYRDSLRTPEPCETLRSAGRGPDGLPVQPRGRGHEDPASHYAAHEIQLRLHPAAVLPAHRGVRRAGCLA